MAAAKQATKRAQEEAEHKLQEIQQQEESRQQNRRDQDWRQLQELREQLTQQQQQHERELETWQAKAAQHERISQSNNDNSAETARLLKQIQDEQDAQEQLIKEHRTKVDDLEYSLERALKRAKDAEEDEQKARARIRHAQDEHDQRLREEMTRFHQLEQAKQRLQGQLEEAQQEAQTASARMEEEQARSQQAQADQQRHYQQLEKDLEDTKVQLELCEQQITEMEEHQQQQQQQNATNADQSEGGDSPPAAEMHVLCQTLERKVKTAETLQQRAQEDMALAEERLELQVAKTTQLAKELADLQSQNTSLSNELEVLRVKLDNLETLEASYKDELEQHGTAMDAADEAKQALERQVTDLNQRIQESERHLQQAKQEAAEQRLKFETLKEEQKRQATVQPKPVVIEKEVIVHKNNSPAKPNPKTHQLVLEEEWTGAGDLVGIYTGWMSKSSNSPDGDGTLRLDDGSVSQFVFRRLWSIALSSTHSICWYNSTFLAFSFFF